MGRRDRERRGRSPARPADRDLNNPSSPSRHCAGASMSAKAHPPAPAPPPSHPDLEIIDAETGFARHIRVDVVRFRHRLFAGGWSCGAGVRRRPPRRGGRGAALRSGPRQRRADRAVPPGGALWRPLAVADRGRGRAGRHRERDPRGGRAARDPRGEQSRTDRGR